MSRVLFIAAGLFGGVAFHGGHDGGRGRNARSCLGRRLERLVEPTQTYYNVSIYANISSYSFSRDILRP